MKQITMELTYPDGQSYPLERPLEAALLGTLESPAQSLSVTFPLAKGSLPGVAVGARLFRGGEEIFSGFCDQQTAWEDSGGSPSRPGAGGACCWITRPSPAPIIMSPPGRFSAAICGPTAFPAWRSRGTTRRESSPSPRG